MSLLDSSYYIQHCIDDKIDYNDRKQFAKLLGLNDMESKLMIMFCEEQFDNSWITVTKEIIVNVFGYANQKTSNSNFKKRIGDC